MKAGPKAAVDATPLPFRSRKHGSARVAAFCAEFVTCRRARVLLAGCGCGRGRSS